MHKRRALLQGIGGAAIAASAVQAQPAWPTRPVTLLVPFAAGGPTDITARLVAERLTAILGQSVVVENRPGGTTIIAAETAAKAAPDGYTLFLTAGTTFTTNPHQFATLPYSIADFAPISLITRLPFAVLARLGLPTTIEAFIAYARANPGKLNYGTTSRGSFSHIVGAAIGDALGFEWQDVPYRGSAPGNADVIAGRLDVNIDAANTAIAAHRAGQATLLAWTGAERMPATPDVPTLAELKPGLVLETWFGLFGQARMPRDRVTRMNEAVQQVLTAPDLRARLIDIGQIPSPNGPEAFATFLAQESARYGDLIRRLHLTTN